MDIMSLNHILDNIAVFVDGVKIEYCFINMPISTTCFKVDCRKKINILIGDTSCSHKLVLMLPIPKEYNTKIMRETDENLFATSYYIDRCKLCVGTVGDINTLEYQNTGFSISIKGKFPSRYCSILISYIYNINSENEIYPWLAVDPSFWNIILKIILHDVKHKIKLLFYFGIVTLHRFWWFA